MKSGTPSQRPNKRLRRKHLVYGGILTVVVLLLVGLGLALVPQGTKKQLPPEQNAAGWLHTDGGRILDENNQVVHLRGVDDAMPAKAFKHIPDAAEMHNLAAWHLTTLRLAIHWDDLEPTAPTNGVHQWDQSSLQQLDDVIALARRDHIKVILDMHQDNWARVFGGIGMPNWLYPGSSQCQRRSQCADKQAAACEFMADTSRAGVPERPQEGLIAVWQMLAMRYKDDPTVVGADMFNEPQGCIQPGLRATYNYPTATDTPLDNFYTTAGQAIQAMNPHLLLIYEDNAYQGYVTRGFALSRRLDLPNAVYSTHFYGDSWKDPNGADSCRKPGGPTGEAVVTAHLDRAMSWNQPFYIGEFDGFHQSFQPRCPYYTDVNGASTDTRAMLALLAERDANWTLWEYSNAQTMLNSDGTPAQPLLSDLQSGLS